MHSIETHFGINNMNMPPKFDVKSWLENLLLNEHRQAYEAMTKEQKTCVRFAYLRGWLIKEREENLKKAAIQAVLDANDLSAQDRIEAIYDLFEGK
jgi:hypothetical protein